MRKYIAAVLAVFLTLGLAGCSNEVGQTRANRAAASTINTVIANNDSVIDSELSAYKDKTFMGNTRINYGGSITVSSDSEEAIKGIATQVVNTTSNVLKVQVGSIDYAVVVGGKSTPIQEYIGEPVGSPVSFKTVKGWVESSK